VYDTADCTTFEEEVDPAIDIAIPIGRQAVDVRGSILHQHPTDRRIDRVRHPTVCPAPIHESSPNPPIAIGVWMDRFELGVRHCCLGHGRYVDTIGKGSEILESFRDYLGRCRDEVCPNRCVPSDAGPILRLSQQARLKSAGES
jgi:hypothetical protein